MAKSSTKNLKTKTVATVAARSRRGRVRPRGLHDVLRVLFGELASSALPRLIEAERMFAAYPSLSHSPCMELTPTSDDSIESVQHRPPNQRDWFAEELSKAGFQKNRATPIFNESISKRCWKREEES